MAATGVCQLPNDRFVGLTPASSMRRQPSSDTTMTDKRPQTLGMSSPDLRRTRTLHPRSFFCFILFSALPGTHPLQRTTHIHIPTFFDPSTIVLSGYLLSTISGSYRLLTHVRDKTYLIRSFPLSQA